jgi:formylglycine-generating enzyme required for sulfatase activity
MGPRAEMDKLGVVVIGASQFPLWPGLEHEAFARSAQAFSSVIMEDGTSLWGRPAVLDLFDGPENQIDLIGRIKQFLQSEPYLTDLIIYYCGHGCFTSDRTYYLALKTTEPDSPATGLMLPLLRNGLEVQLALKRVFLILDCCFAGEVVRRWQTNAIGIVVESNVFDAFPKSGTAVIAASAKNSPAIVAGPLTMFTGALVEAIKQGIPSRGRELSFRDVLESVRSMIGRNYGKEAVYPEIHTPHMEGGVDISFKHMFINRAFAGPAHPDEQTLARVKDELTNEIPTFRLAAIEALERLLAHTQSSEVHAKIVALLRVLAEGDDSNKVRDRSRRLLAGLDKTPRGGPVPLVFIPGGRLLRGLLPSQLGYIIKKHEEAGAWIKPANLRARLEEEPPTEVQLSPFRIGITPVTNEQFSMFVRETKYRTSAEKKGDGDNWRAHLVDRPNHPVVYVSFLDAQEFCSWSGLSLPTYDQWRRAFRGDDRRIYAWGDEFDLKKCNTAQSCVGMETTPVDRFPQGVSRFGCYDMVGNVQEWTTTEKAGGRVVVGGAWDYGCDVYGIPEMHLRADPDFYSNDLGFRCIAAA